MTTGLMGKPFEKGFSLVELMFVVAIFTIIGAALFAVLRASEEQTRVVDLKMTIQESAREGLDKMSQEIRQTAPNQITIGASNDTIQFLIPDPNAANPLDASFYIDWNNAHTIQYALATAADIALGFQANQLIRTDVTGGNAKTVMANDVQSVTFSGNSDLNVITITLSVQRTLLNGRVIPPTPLDVTVQTAVRNS